MAMLGQWEQTKIRSRTITFAYFIIFIHWPL